jgi:altronate hydrolase
VDTVVAFPHPYGCSQMGEDQENTRKILSDLVNHPNAGGVLVLGLGCENSGVDVLKPYIGAYDERRVKFLVAQESDDEIADSVALIGELIEYASAFEREPLNVDHLVVGMKCGGSDGLSGITANPLVGRLSDLLISRGGTTILTEVPEMFGAETILMNRCASQGLFHQTVGLINHFKRYFNSHNQVIYENPSPGNKEGGISTLEDKSLGCTQKSGNAPVKGVLSYGETVKTPGLNLLSAPGNDLVATTALAAAGAQIVLFTTGRGTPFAGPVPTVKIASNSRLASKKANWIDYNAGTIVEMGDGGEGGNANERGNGGEGGNADETGNVDEGGNVDESGNANKRGNANETGNVNEIGNVDEGGNVLDEEAGKLFRYVLEVACGRKVCSEEAGFHDMAIFKQGVTL